MRLRTANDRRPGLPAPAPVRARIDRPGRTAARSDQRADPPRAAATLKIFGALIMFSVGGWDIGQAADSGFVSEQQLKAAILPRLALFMSWPETAFAQANDPVRIGVLGGNP